MRAFFDNIYRFPMNEGERDHGLLSRSFVRRGRSRWGQRAFREGYRKETAWGVAGRGETIRNGRQCF